jgi:hypothetical protein
VKTLWLSRQPPPLYLERMAFILEHLDARRVVVILMDCRDCISYDPAVCLAYLPKHCGVVLTLEAGYIERAC